MVVSRIPLQPMRCLAFNHLPETPNLKPVKVSGPCFSPPSILDCGCFVIQLEAIYGGACSELLLFLFQPPFNPAQTRSTHYLRSHVTHPKTGGTGLGSQLSAMCPNLDAPEM